MIRRYVAFLDRHARAVAAIVIALVAASLYLVAFHLPIRADFVYLLPDDSPALRDRRLLEARIPAKDSTLIVLTAPDARSRAVAATQLIEGVRALGPRFIERLEIDDADTRAFLREHRFLFVPYDDLVAARDALTNRLARANPLYVDLGDGAAPTKQLDDLRARRRDAEARLARSSYISADGTAQLVVVRMAFVATDVALDRDMLHQLDHVFAAVRASHPGVDIGVAGGVANAVAEHDAVANGIAISSAITALLVAAVLLIHLRGVRLLAIVTVQIVAATLISFGIAALAVGHLNSATAFLGAIIAGNGVNYGILVVARFLEEHARSASSDPRDTVGVAIAGTLVPTLVASLGASISYGALAMTRFKGFSDFAIIGGAGMLVCWLVAFTLLPILLLRFPGRPTRPTASPLFGTFVVRAFGSRRSKVVLAALSIVTLIATVITWQFIASDPFEYDMTKIRSDAPAAIEAQRWMSISNAAFGKGIVGRTYLGVPSRDDVAPLVDTLRDLRDHDPDGTTTIGLVQSILDVEPPDQARKLAVLAEIRSLVDKALTKLDPDEAKELAELRPPDSLRAIRDLDLPAELASQFREVDGNLGLIVAVRPAATFNELDGRAMLRFAGVMQHVSATKTGTSLIFADILDINRHDGPIVTTTAALGLVIMVLALVGRNRRALAVLAATTAGSITMVAACALIGLKINFLDFVALPIALGLGIDYAINVAHRAADAADPLDTLRTTGGTVFVCSLTTMIGYASLLVSDNHAIRDFGLASLIGEITCVIAALTLVPALLAHGAHRSKGAAPEERANA